MYQPSPAERARTVLRVATSVSLLTTPDQIQVVAVPGADATGAPLLLARSPRYADQVGEQPCVLHAVDVSPTPLPDRIRGEVWLGGWLAAVPDDERDAAIAELADGRLDADPPDPGAHLGTAFDADLLLVRLEIADVRLRDRVYGGGRAVEVDPDTYAGAAPDPLADGEAEWLGHLMAAHTAEFAQLCRLVPRRARPAGARLRPVALDRYGLLLRIDSGGGHRHVRLPFPAPVDCPGRLPDAMTQLLHAAAAYPTKKGL